MRAVINIALRGLGDEGLLFELLECELDRTYFEVDLGDIDVFDPEDFDQPD
jgi:hypothetical protein